MGDEFKLKKIRSEIKQKLYDLFCELKDAQKVYLEANRTGHEVGYPEVVEYLQHHPLARTLPLESRYKDRRSKNYTRTPKSPKPPIINLRLPEKISTPTLESKVTEIKEIPPEKTTQTKEPEIPSESRPRQLIEGAQELYNAFTKLLHYKASKLGQEYEQAILIDKKTARKFEFEDIVNIIRTYETKQKQGFPVKTLEISRETAVKFSSTKKIIEQINEINSPPIDETLSQRINRALTIKEINLKEAAYFLGIPKFTLTSHIQKNKIPYFKKILYYNFIEASKVYEATDAGFNLRQTAEYSKANKRNTEHSLNRRPYLEPIIIEILKKIYPEREITTPYL